uniref:Putative conserved plasma membrane protein n=1 Tax=Amblyomma cajennense TaxID=34607 RepID=A0A023FQK0_AMBCJ
MSSSTTTVRQTTTVTSSGSSPVVALSVNTTFLSSIGGILTVIELILGIIVFSLCYQYAFGHSGIFLLLISFAYWLVSFYILFSAFLSASGTLLPNTFFYFLFHVFGVLLYAAGGIAVLAQLNRFSPSGTIAAGAMGLIAAICHVVHVAFIYKGPKL